MKSLVLLDEPEAGLHPGAQARLRDFLAGIARDAKHQVIYATHSPFMINPNHIRQVRLVGKESTTCVVENKPYRELHKQPIQSALQLPLGYSLFLAEQNVIVEGVSDQTLLVALSQVCASYGLSYLDLRKTSIIPAGGGGENIFGDMRVRASKHEGLCTPVYDKDEMGFRELKKANEAQCGGLYATGEEWSSEVVPETKFTVEDLVPRRVYVQAFKKNYADVCGRGILNDGAPVPDEMAKLLDGQAVQTPILPWCEQFTASRLAVGGYDFRKNDVAREAAPLLLEEMPAAGQRTEVLYEKADLEAVSRLFQKVNEKFAAAVKDA